MISLGLTLCFLAISTDFALNSFRYGFASFFAWSYEIAPCNNKSLIRCSSLIASITAILRFFVISSRFIKRRPYEEMKPVEPVKNHNAIRAGSMYGFPYKLPEP